MDAPTESLMADSVQLKFATKVRRKTWNFPNFLGLIFSFVGVGGGHGGTRGTRGPSRG
jgi:hypothetical protein